MNGLIATRERKMLRHHPAVIAAIDRFWHTLSKNPISYDTPDQYCIRWKACNSAVLLHRLTPFDVLWRSSFCPLPGVRSIWICTQKWRVYCTGNSPRFGRGKTLWMIGGATVRRWAGSIWTTSALLIRCLRCVYCSL